MESINCFRRFRLSLCILRRISTPESLQRIGTVRLNKPFRSVPVCNIHSNGSDRYGTTLNLIINTFWTWFKITWPILKNLIGWMKICTEPIRHGSKKSWNQFNFFFVPFRSILIRSREPTNRTRDKLWCNYFSKTIETEPNRTDPL